MTTEEIRSQFPQLQRTVYGKPLVYLDNAATSLRPQSVIDRWSDISAHSTANLHRAVHHVAAEATETYENARRAVAEFINAPEAEEVIFTSGASLSLIITVTGIVIFALSLPGFVLLSQVYPSVLSQIVNTMSWLPSPKFLLRKSVSEIFIVRLFRMLPSEEEPTLKSFTFVVCDVPEAFL